MEVSNPRRVLAICLEDETQHLSKVVADLTGKAPESTSTSLAGTTHDLTLETPYYNATVPMWIDLITSSSEWSASFLSEEAGEVLAVLGGLVLVFAVPTTTSPDRTRELIKDVGKVMEKGLGGWQWDGVGLAVGVGEGNTEEWDELCAQAGLEFVQVTSKVESGRNEFGEKTGIARVKEALESNDWAALDGDDGLSDFGELEDGSEKANVKDVDDPENMDFGYDKADFEGLRRAIWENQPVEEPDLGVDAWNKKETGDRSQHTVVEDPTNTKQKDGAKNGEEVDGKEGLDDDDVMRVELMMRKLQAVREAGEGLGPEQRKRMAAKAVREVMADFAE